MTKNFLFLFCLLVLSSCATVGGSVTGQYENIYNQTVAAGKSLTLYKSGEFQSVKEHVDQQLKIVGYDNVLASNPAVGFLVLVKDIPLAKAMAIGDAHPYRIILKYTKAGLGRTRIDLVNGSPGLLSGSTVEEDIQKLLELIGVDVDMGKKKEEIIKELIHLIDPSHQEEEALKDTFKKITRVNRSEWDRLLEEINFDVVAALYYPVYDKYFTRDEIKILVDFYSSDVGVKLARSKSDKFPRQTFTENELEAVEQFRMIGVGKKAQQIIK